MRADCVQLDIQDARQEIIPQPEEINHFVATYARYMHSEFDRVVTSMPRESSWCAPGERLNRARSPDFGVVTRSVPPASTRWR